MNATTKCLALTLILLGRPTSLPAFQNTISNEDRGTETPRSLDSEQVSRKSLMMGSLQLEESDQAIEIHQTNQLVLRYNKCSPLRPKYVAPIFERSGFFHPVCSPKGRTLTAAFPYDHLHQHGIFSAWVRTRWAEREIDFWNLGVGTGRVLHEQTIDTFSGDSHIGFTVDLIHRAEQLPAIDILRERWVVRAWETDGTYHCFDVETHQHALTDKPLVIEKFHYGGMAYRGPVCWLTEEDSEYRKHRAENQDVPPLEPSQMVNESGVDRINGNHQRTRWVVMQGDLDGQPASIAVLSHSANFRAPQPARLHPTKPYFAFAPCVEQAFEIDREHPYRASYRYCIADHHFTHDWLENQWKSFEASSQDSSKTHQ